MFTKQLVDGIIVPACRAPTNSDGKRRLVSWSAPWVCSIWWG
ncbi:MAG: hypothetical protein ACLRSW_05235 [Christensenellaceae bacterium]